jgi:hypothetical protein
MNTNKPMGFWIDVLVQSVGKYIKLETKDGIRREGRLSSLENEIIIFNDEEVELIKELQLNNDPFDSVPFERVKEFEIVE